MINVYKSLQSYLGVPEDRTCGAETEGIRVVLESPTGTDCFMEREHRIQTPPLRSLRRTLSADMSSQSWTAASAVLKESASFQHLKGILSFEDDQEEQELKELESRPDEDAPVEEEKEQDFWSLIRGDQPMQRTDAFAALIPGTDRSQVEPCKPYVHPNAKRRHKLSEKSLQLCTEGLGSETGSDCSLSDYSFDDSSDNDEDDISEGEVEEIEEEDARDGVESEGFSFSDHFNGNRRDCFDLSVGHNAENKTNAVFPQEPRKVRSFPPPLPSLSRGSGASVLMKSVKEDGRFMLKAVTISSQKYLQAHREHGRLQLHFIASNTNASLLQDDVTTAADESAEDEYVCEKAIPNALNTRHNTTKSQVDIPVMKNVLDSYHSSAGVTAGSNLGFVLHNNSKLKERNNNVGLLNKKPTKQIHLKSHESPTRRASVPHNKYVRWRNEFPGAQSPAYPSSFLGTYSHINKSQSALSQNESAHSLPDLSSQKSFSSGRCKGSRRLLSNMEPPCYGVA